MTVVALHALFADIDSGVWGAEDAESGISVIRSTNFTAEGSLDLTKLALRSVEGRRAKLLRPGDILLEKSGGGPKQPVGRVAIFRGDSRPHLFGNFIARLRVKGDACLPEFAFYNMRALHERGVTTFYQKQTTGIRNLEMKRYLDHEVNLPSLVEQRRMVDILDRAASVRRLRQQAQDTAREIIPALFNKMFGDPATNPMGWNQVLIQSLADVQGGLQVTTARASLPLERPYLRVANVLRDKLDLTEVKTIRLTPAELARVRLESNDLLVVEGHGNPEEVGRVAVWNGSIKDCVHQNHIIRVRCGSSIDPLYLCAALNSLGGRRILNSRGKTTSGLNTISVSNIKQAMVPLPPWELQHQFAKASWSIRRMLTRHSEADRAAILAAQAIQARLLG